jgi:hypothetical protein
VPRYRLHYFPESGNSYKLTLMLTLSGQPWEPVWTDFMGGQTRSPEWRATVNEMGEIPVLEGWLTVIGWLLRSPPFCRFLLRRGWFLREAAFQGGHQIDDRRWR